MTVPVWSGDKGAFVIHQNGTMPSVTGLKDGSFIVVWAQTNAQGNTDIRAQLYEASGSKKGAEFTIGGTAGNERDPAVTALENGGFVVTWEDRASTSVQAAVFGTEREQDGTPKLPLKSFEVKFDNETNDHANSSVAALPLPDGGFVISVTGSLVGANTNTVASYIYDAAGERKGTSEFTRSGSLARDTDVAALQSGNDTFYMTVASLAGSGTIPHKVSVEIRSSAAQPVKTVFDVASMAATNNLPAVSVTALENGLFVVAWTVQNTIQAKIFKADGSGGENTIELYRSDVSNVILSRITVETIGNGFALAFQESLSDGSNSEVYVKAFDASGAETFSKTAPYGDDALPLSQIFPSMAVLEDGRLIVNWREGEALHGRIFDPARRRSSSTARTSARRFTARTSPRRATPSTAALATTRCPAARGMISSSARSGANTPNGADHFNGGEGKDNVSYWWIRNAGTDTTGIKIYMDHSSDSTGAAAGDIYNSIEVIDGTLYDDTIEGDANANGFWGSDGHDSLAGGAGNDTLNGGIGDDLFLGGEGNDIMIAAEGGKDTFEGGAGEDKVSYFFAGPIELYMHGRQANRGAAAGASFKSIEVIDGTFHNDILEGDGDNNAFWGANGADSLKGFEGSDVLKGGEDGDTLFGGAGADTLDGENGFDWASYADAAGAVSVSLVSGRGLTGEAAGDSLVPSRASSAPATAIRSPAPPTLCAAWAGTIPIP
jgi:hypothetical protein